jgi:hypothetical protein
MAPRTVIGTSSHQEDRHAMAPGTGAAGRRVRGGPEVQSATRRAGTVAPRLRGALIQAESNSAMGSHWRTRPAGMRCGRSSQPGPSSWLVPDGPVRTFVSNAAGSDLCEADQRIKSAADTAGLPAAKCDEALGRVRNGPRLTVSVAVSVAVTGAPQPSQRERTIAEPPHA